jgi:arylsulfatase A-like enzyme
VTSDHGEGFGDHGEWFHGNSIHEEEVAVPLLIKYPGQTSGSVVQTPISQVDILPTVLDTLGYPVPSHVQGHSLRNPGELQNRQLLAESVAGRALRWGSLKLIVAAQGKRELYDLAKDPEESHNLYLPIRPESKMMDDFYAKWLRMIPHREQGAAATDSDELRHLRGLGYVQ